ncbi:hypothetical protein ACM01_15860 [Streptomyces viridochromogenes]|uniref:DUF317 domain-containing protein n=1 Tax=Streptomyces viridochromogenes TaxID=1938 RepID=A0A0J7ZDE3_STRVR|nr:DUF317 domain-containing protein [Streptomyces viridochromogenes]KMS74096.1 hypothetical protein ACM01_15860 [Streptomyces viridochromogenes]
MTRPYISSKADDPWARIWFDTSPRHLAGPGDPRRVTQALRAGGWKNYGDPDFPHVVLASPDLRHTLVLEPAPDTYASWWRISSNADGQHWHASFGGNTPVEIIAGFTDALLHPAPASELDVWPTLQAADWTYERDERGNESARHPDGITSMERRATLTSYYFAWTAEVALPTGLGGQKRLWHAYFDDRTPCHLLAGFATALADPAPVSRGHYDVPHAHLVTQVERGAQGEQLAAAHDARLKAIRSAVRKARRSAAPTTRPAPAPATEVTTPVTRGR